MGKPDGEVSRFERVHAVAHGPDRVQVVELDRTGDLPVPFGLNCFHFGNSCRRRQFAGFEDVLKVLRNGCNSHAEEIGDGPLGETRRAAASQRSPLDPCGCWMQNAVRCGSAGRKSVIRSLR